MKKFILTIAVIAFGFVANAQKAGFNAGADVTYNFDGENFGLMAEANYLFELSDEFRVGPAISYQYAFGQDVTITDPLTGSSVTVSADGSGDFTLAGAARYDISENFVIGADLGFYFDASAFYYRPVVGYKIGESTMIQLALPSSDATNSLSLGVMFGL
ncbi:hypothetical protein [uncultured Tenacibaculum sp.]|uniref:hypothetical protein n=1 Tax=uncultured Tenacibaculum sp. TaxID=174713 RepID=UPI00261BF2D0|nr:hypothetical protein [uncultured Tenacibaculum sp.]